MVMANISHSNAMQQILKRTEYRFWMPWNLDVITIPYDIVSTGVSTDSFEYFGTRYPSRVSLAM